MSDSAVKSARRVLQIMELFEAERRPLRIAQIVGALNLPQSSVSMLMRTMREEGYVDFDGETRTYSPSVRLAFLGSWAVGPSGTTDDLAARMKSLFDATGETIVLGRLIGTNMQYLSVLDSREALRFSLHPGLVRTSFRTGIGIAVLATRDDAEIGRLVNRHNAERPADTDAVGLDWVMGEIAEARSCGYYQSKGHTTPGAAVLAMALPPFARGHSLGLGIGAPIVRLEARHDLYLTALREAVSERGRAA